MLNTSDNALSSLRSALGRNLGFTKIVVNFAARKPLGAAGGAIVIVLVLIAILAPVIAPYDPAEPHIELILSGPSTELLLGGDELGRDMLSRLFYGARVSLFIGLVTVSLGISAGALLGVASAYFGGTFDLIIQRGVDALMAFPTIILALALIAVLGSSVINIIIALCIVLAPSSIRTVRSQALAVKEMDYVLAARAIGASDGRIILRYIVPNVFAIFIVISTIQLGAVIIAESSLSFLGVGVPVDVPTWGGMLAAATESDLQVSHWQVIFPGIAISLAVFGINFLGDALRDVLDPKLRGR